jgi:glycogen synthase
MPRLNMDPGATLEIMEGSNSDVYNLISYKQHKVVAVSGEAARKAFFGNHRLNFAEGYKILTGIVCYHDFYSQLFFI